MRYLPHSPKDIGDMLQALGMTDLDELFRDIPEDLRLREPISMPPPLSEWEVRAHLARLADRNLSLDKAASF
ncbi:MAG: glycine dehydrogenase, partial [Armatimonadetes bacterium]|nr:glycine dehydrogenase [Armatimonadota bacterium]